MTEHQSVFTLDALPQITNESDLVAVNILLGDDLAPYVFKPFTIGKENYVIYGNPVEMMRRVPIGLSEESPTG